MNILPETDWAIHKTWLNVAGIEYDVTAHVFLKYYSGGGVDATLEGFETVPECSHKEQIEAALIEEIEQEYEVPWGN